ncbi:MAG: FtsW/RodA/SpoVE family cell cycle protein [Bacteroidetes bacterium]|nr:FtsW/RodA/SpoVE family cell cycle protein [Bacteroidota bacterium]
MENNLINKYLKGDRMIWLVVAILSVFSILAVYSSTGSLAYRFQQGNTEYYVLKHLVILVLGFVIIYFTHKINYINYAKIARLGLIVVVPLLFFTLLSGHNVNEASRWLKLPVMGLTFQTSDFAKIALLLFLSRALSKRQDQPIELKDFIINILLPVLVICALIVPANFSTAAVLFVTSLTVMFIGRIPFKHMAMLFGAGVICLVLFIGVSKLVGYEGRIATWMERIENFSEPKTDEIDQSTQAKIAIAKGGAFGVGPGKSTQRNFLPQAFNDFIFAIICEEYGVWGAALILFMYIILMFRAVSFVRKSPKAFASLLAFGCCFSLVFQAMINMAVATNLFPVTGQALPMVSMGGTSIWFTSIAIGILLSISKSFEQEGG